MSSRKFDAKNASPYDTVGFTFPDRLALDIFKTIHGSIDSNLKDSMSGNV